MQTLFVLLGSIGKDKIRAISTSKIRNKRATKKNCNEKGTCEGFITLNPHSNCDHASFLLFIFFWVAWTKIIKITNSNRDTVQIIVILIYFFTLFNWKLNVLL